MTDVKDDETDDLQQPKQPKKPAKQTDLPDNEHDAERMKGEEVTLDLPDAEEIPGQEHIHVPRMREMEDVTIASDDEEGVSIFGDDEEDEDDVLLRDSDSNITAAEEDVLETSMTDLPGEDERVRRSELDRADNDGDELNEGSTATDVTGGDLDTSGTDEDDNMEDIGEEDEENNMYSLGGDDNENLEEDKA